MLINGIYVPNDPTKTILQSIEMHNIAFNKGCNNGFCGSCRCKKIQGKISYIQQPLAMMNKDEIIPCMAISTTNDLVIEQ